VLRGARGELRHGGWVGALHRGLEFGGRDVRDAHRCDALTIRLVSIPDGLLPAELDVGTVI
jgi:hypothetical protein